MDPAHGALLVLAGIAAGLAGSVAGLASLVSYPALLAAGLAPVPANVTNSVALIFASAGSVSGSRPELRGQGARVLRLGSIALLGGVVGAVLILIEPPGQFERTVPLLIGASSVAILFIRRSGGGVNAAAEPAAVSPKYLIPSVFAIGVYGGYFGAAAGVLMLALLLATTTDALPTCNAVKNSVLGIGNLVAAVLFAVFATVDWVAVVPLAIGLFIGGRTGPIIVRRARADILRTGIAIAGICLAVYLGYKTYR